MISNMASAMENHDAIFLLECQDICQQDDHTGKYTWVSEHPKRCSQPSPTRKLSICSINGKLPLWSCNLQDLNKMLQCGVLLFGVVNSHPASCAKLQGFACHSHLILHFCPLQQLASIIITMEHIHSHQALLEFLLGFFPQFRGSFCFCFVLLLFQFCFFKS